MKWVAGNKPLKKTLSFELLDPLSCWSYGPKYNQKYEQCKSKTAERPAADLYRWGQP